MARANTFIKNISSVAEILNIAADQRSNMVAELYDIATQHEMTVSELVDEITTNSGIYSRMELDDVRLAVGKKFKKRPGRPAKRRGNVAALPPPASRPVHTPPPEPKWNLASTSMQPMVSTISNGETDTPNVVLYTPKVKAIIDYLVHSCTQEVGWLGTVQATDQGYLIDAIYVPQQTVHATETDIGPEAMAALAEELFSKGKDPGTLYYWGHSHVNMGVTPSGQDERQVREYLDGCPRFIRGIYNKRGDSKVDIYLREQRIVHQCVQQRITFALTPEEKTHLSGVIARNVKKAAGTGYNYSAYGTNSYHGDI